MLVTSMHPILNMQTQVMKAIEKHNIELVPSAFDIRYPDHDIAIYRKINRLTDSYIDIFEDSIVEYLDKLLKFKTEDVTKEYYLVEDICKLDEYGFGLDGFERSIESSCFARNLGDALEASSDILGYDVAVEDFSPINESEMVHCENQLKITKISIFEPKNINIKQLNQSPVTRLHPHFDSKAGKLDCISPGNWAVSVFSKDEFLHTTSASIRIGISRLLEKYGAEDVTEEQLMAVIEAFLDGTLSFNEIVELENTRTTIKPYIIYIIKNYDLTGYENLPSDYSFDKNKLEVKKLMALNLPHAVQIFCNIIEQNGLTDKSAVLTYFTTFCSNDETMLVMDNLGFFEYCDDQIDIDEYEF